MTDISVINFRKRREERLAKRGYNIKKNEYRKTKDDVKVEKPMKAAVREDAPEEEEQNNGGGGGSKSGGGSGGGHGNTRLPYGLCQKAGIEIGEDWTPRDAWDALAGKGITPGSAYEALKKGEGLGSLIKEPEKPKEPKKTLTEGGKVVSELKGSHVSWDRDTPYRLRGRYEDGYSYYKYFGTKNDIMSHLKDGGVEEFEDPDTGEIVNPSEMDLPKCVLKIDDGYTIKGYSAVSMGMRNGRYYLYGVGMDGKKRKIDDYTTLSDARKFLNGKGVSMEDVKMSPVLKKYEKARTAWVNSDKKEYIEEDGVKYGDIKCHKNYYGYVLTATSVDGDRHAESFKGRTSLMSYLKDMGVEKATVDGEVVNPQEFEPPKKVATIDGTDYQELQLQSYGGYDGDDYFSIHGIDMEGKDLTLVSMRSSETFNQFMKRAKDSYGIPEEMLKMGEEQLAARDRRIQKDEEKERRKREFESKAMTIGAYKYTDVELIHEDYYGDYRIIGYNVNGEKENVTYRDGMASIYDFMQTFNIDPDKIIKDPEVREAYDAYEKHLKEFDLKAIDFGGRKYSDMFIGTDGDYYILYGTDKAGTRRRVRSFQRYETLRDEIVNEGHSVDSFDMNDEAKELYDNDQKLEERIKNEGYHRLVGERGIYKDVYIEKDSVYGWSIRGSSIKDEDTELYNFSTQDEAVDFLEGREITDYKIHSGDKVFGRPIDGIRSVMIMKAPDGYKIMATVGKGERREVASTTSEADAMTWLKDNNIDSGNVKTKGMNPNDDVPRTHTAVSLAKFDAHRAEREEDYAVLDMSAAEKQEVVDMMTDVFNQGAYRIRMRGHFEDVYDTHFKNLLETGTSGGSTDKGGRRVTGKKVFGHDYDIEPINAEKYGYLGLEDDIEAYDSGVASWYGDIVYKFKKSAINDRITYTAADTLDGGRPLAGYAGDKPTYEGVSPLSKIELREVMSAYRKYKKGEMTFQDFWREFSSNCENGYIEIQYHDMLTMNDVESITFPKDKLDSTFAKMKQEKRKKILDDLESRGIIIQYEDYGVFKNAYDYLRAMYGI